MENPYNTKEEWLHAFLTGAVKTADRYLIIDGMVVWDYNLKVGTVDLKRLGDDGWFHVLVDGYRSLMNAERICVTNPFDGKVAKL
jgi:hypothetical protein